MQRKLQARTLERGLCQCGRDKLDSYSCCQRCETRNIQTQRRLRNRYFPAHLYVALTPCGLKVGRSSEPRRRMGELRCNMFAGGDVKLLMVYEGKGHLELFVHMELNAHRLPDRREVFSCNPQTVTAVIDRVILDDLLGIPKEMRPDESRGRQIQRNDHGARAPIQSPSTPSRRAPLPLEEPEPEPTAAAAAAQPAAAEPAAAEAQEAPPVPEPLAAPKAKARAKRKPKEAVLRRAKMEVVRNSFCTEKVS